MVNIKQVDLLKERLAKLQARCERKANDNCVPPPIKSSAIQGIAKRMDKIEKEIETLELEEPRK